MMGGNIDRELPCNLGSLHWDWIDSDLFSFDGLADWLLAYSMEPLPVLPSLTHALQPRS